MQPRLWCFCSSRRRHTRCLSDWSSDVCSSDLQADFAIFKLIEAGRRAVQNEVDVAKFLSGGDGEDVFLGSVIVCRIVLMPELVKTRQVDRRVQEANTPTSPQEMIKFFHLQKVLSRG